jgi:hypothetical protein
LPALDSGEASIVEKNQRIVRTIVQEVIQNGEIRLAMMVETALN